MDIGTAAERGIPHSHGLGAGSLTAQHVTGPEVLFAHGTVEDECAIPAGGGVPEEDVVLPYVVGDVLEPVGGGADFPGVAGVVGEGIVIEARAREDPPGVIAQLVARRLDHVAPVAAGDVPPDDAVDGQDLRARIGGSPTVVVLHQDVLFKEARAAVEKGEEAAPLGVEHVAADHVVRGAEPGRRTVARLAEVIALDHCAIRVADFNHVTGQDEVVVHEELPGEAVVQKASAGTARRGRRRMPCVNPPFGSCGQPRPGSRRCEPNCRWWV